MLSKLNLTGRDLKLCTHFSKTYLGSAPLNAGLGSYPNLLLTEHSGCRAVSPDLGTGRYSSRRGSWQLSPHLLVAGTAPGALQMLCWLPCTSLQPSLLHHQ